MKAGPNHKIAKTILALLSEHAPETITPALIARKSGLTATQIARYFVHTDDMLDLVVTHIDAQTQKNTGKPDKSLPSADLLFDYLMARFDAMGPAKQAHDALATYARKKPEAAHRLCLALSESMKQALAHAGIRKHSGLHVYALLAIYTYTFTRWTTDMSADLSPTMARLDTSLKKLGKYLPFTTTK